MKSPIPFCSRLTSNEQLLWIDKLSNLLPEETIRPCSELSDLERHAADFAIVANPDPKELLTLPNLIWVQSVWAGVERMLEELPNVSFNIARMVDPNLSKTMSEAVLSWVLYLHRDMPAYLKQQQKAEWHQHFVAQPEEVQIGVLGLGELGQVCAKRLKGNYFRVSGWSRSQKELEGIECYSGEEGLDSILSQSDIIVILLPSTPSTKELINLETVKKMKPGAQIINFGRGPIIDEDALLYGLNTGLIKHAVLDVFNREPLPRSHAFWTYPSITVLPHISAPTNPDTASVIVANNIRAYRNLNMLPECVDVKKGY
ncbi:2-hydroxyacid dehydrogenase [Marinomonas mediterranea]|jgi:Phosphoglycerate dehydrogenase and related dehydrogenases|uniref:Glyoxylate reductase (NADP(+)) n=1 Tax=Marinomonas mediterranea (strain ATCC 700492 / JCM 21426 / NBRC 103028 / MMB-1) TaxID=717774 RepID=F2JVN6_MARM1|nr:glyoxylate/hydroxypyruvate reductase A [Marinomonas mediterranea]ADZ90580.1 Glyoxylate reductase (NADP(+)) [Marinomonas mediterranea MMB-1]WCN16755.1 glyoxylate/hydroxypyruvate reductase A [Marinomonas mediterranea MMB-1]